MSTKVRGKYEYVNSPPSWPFPYLKRRNMKITPFYFTINPNTSISTKTKINLISCYFIVQISTIAAAMIVTAVTSYTYFRSLQAHPFLPEEDDIWCREQHCPAMYAYHYQHGRLCHKRSYISHVTSDANLCCNTYIQNYFGWIFMILFPMLNWTYIYYFIYKTYLHISVILHNYSKSSNNIPCMVHYTLWTK